jgi:serine/threonine protein kinase/tetratricopeptide (TPR) repeat protein
MASVPPLIERTDEIGSGATGRVWHGLLTEPFAAWPAGTEVAVKALHAEHLDDPAACSAFAVEGAVGQRVRDPGLVRVIYAGESSEGPELVMQFVPGETLRAVLEGSGPLPEPLLRSVAAQVAGGLAALHAAGYAHGDIKPENMRLDADGRAVLMDLGFARRLDGETKGQGGANAGSLAYLAPERTRGRAGDDRSDVFALGVVMYELATGRHPFAEAESGAFSSVLPLPESVETPAGDRLLAAIAAARFVPPSRHAPRLTPFLDQLLSELLARDPASRPDSEEVYRRLTEQESGEWWREHLDRTGPAVDAAAPASSHLTPLVGRTAELDELRALWSGVDTSHSGAVVWLGGPAGSGKSRLMSDFAAAVRKSPEPPTYLYGRCRSLEAQRPCGPVLALLQRWLELPIGAPPGERERDRLARSVRPQAAETLAQALTPDFEGTTTGAVPTALAEWVVAVGADQRLVVFLDDLNFADEASLMVLRQVATQLDATQLMLVLGTRDDEPHTRPEAFARLAERIEDRGAGTRVSLGPLDEDAVLALVGELFDHTVPRRRVSQVLWDRSRGNPGMIAEILRGLMERGDARPVAPGERRLQLSIAPEKIPMPSSLGTVINDRFRRLSPIERAWVRRLSVVGGRMDPEFLQRAFAETPAPEMGRMLTRLVNAGWLVPIGDRYRFARPALREAVYRSTSEQDKRAIHTAAANALAPRGGTLSIADALQRAFHLQAAGDHARLLRVLAPLIEALLRRGQPQRVHALARWGLAALDAGPRTRHRDRMRISFLEAAADAADRLGHRDEQRRWLDHLSDIDLSPELEPETLARVYLLHGRYAVSTGQYGLARGMLRNSVQLAEGEGVDDVVLSEALRRLAAVQAHVGELAEARDLARRARDRAVHEPQRAVSWLTVGVIELLGDDMEPALRAVDRALGLLRRARDWHLPGIAAAGQMLRGRTYRIAGRPRRALASMNRAVRMAQQAGERRLEAEATARLGGLLLDVNRAREAEDRLREALLLATEIEDRRGQALAGLWLGVLLFEQSDPTAKQVIERVVRIAREIGLGRVEALALAIRARVRRDGGRLEAALRDVEAAATKLEQRGGELADRIVIQGTRALLLSDVGRPEDGAELVRRMRRGLRRVNERIAIDVTRRRHRVASTRLLEAVLSAEGVIYPRVRFQDSTEGLLGEAR